MGKRLATLTAPPEHAPPDRLVGRRSTGRTLPEHWPLTAALAGFPIWWVLGFTAFVPILLAFPMLLQLSRRRRVLLPPGFAIWALFLVWVLLGVMVLGADAPGAVPGGSAFGRMLVFGYRVSWYLACTVVLVWLGNADSKAVSFRRVAQLMGFMFVVTTAGGLVGLVAPTLELSSLLELALPRSLRANSFVRSMVHLETADVQNVLGRPEARPKAPFAFANSWGSNFSLYLPFFVLAWFRYGRPWQRALGPLVLALGAIPVVYSLNRGLWLSLAVGAGVVLLLALRRGRPALILATALVLATVVIGLAISPLGHTLQDRMDHQHSNDRRSQLLTTTVRSTATGSPVVGFGSTRDVQGAFSSIAGGATPDCHACGVPDLGTQGHLWMVIFSQGLVGAALFLAFFVKAASGSWRCRTDTEIIAGLSLLFFFLQLPVYDTLGMPMFTVMTAIALAWRDRRLAAPTAVGTTTARSAWLTLRRAAPALVFLTISGAAAGSALSAGKPQEYTARASVLLAPSPVYLAADALEPGKGRPTTVDTEAALALSDRSLDRVAATLPHDVTSTALRSHTTVTATPNTRVLHLDVRAGNAQTALREVKALADAYLSVREEYLSQRRSQTLGLLAQKLAELDSPLPPGTRPAGAPTSSDSDSRRRSRETLVRITNFVLLSPTSAGEAIRYAPPVKVGKQIEVGAASGAGAGLVAGAMAIAFSPVRGLRRAVPARRRRARRKRQNGRHAIA